MAISKNDRAYSSGKYGIELDNVHAGWVKTVDGGHATADVVSEKIGSDHLTKKHLGGVKYEEISFQCGAGMTNKLYDWIETGFNQTSNASGRQNGAVVFADYDSNEINRLTWQHGLITEFGMPALDAASKDAALMSIKFKPEITRKTMNGGGKIKMPIDASKQKNWLPANFRLRIDGLEEGCSRVNKIEALTIKQKTTENAVGEQRDYQQEPTSVEIPNLVITLAESHSKAFFDWHEDFVIKGNNGEDHEKGGTLEYLTPNLQEVLFTLHFYHLGVFKVAPDKVEASAEPIRRLKVEMYCEDIQFGFSSSAIYGQK